MNTVFDVVFGVFVVAIVALAVLAVRWGVRRDRLARDRRPERDPATRITDTTPVTPGPAGEGHTP